MTVHHAGAQLNQRLSDLMNRRDSFTLATVDKLGRREQQKRLFKGSFSLFASVEAKIAGGTINEQTHRAVAYLRERAEMLQKMLRLDAECLGPGFMDDELNTLATELDLRVAAMEIRMAPMLH